uniref:CUB domain-containing protein n=1 Tax=Branchiostoma floridae TaxID=7739 RepID=C3YNG8_BRAFL|eukprot:XP_002602262.1 hypothetical protein BRAFLDRAFT_76950 [Branchiostoma floridae]
MVSANRMIFGWKLLYLPVFCLLLAGFVVTVEGTPWLQMFATVKGTGQTAVDAWNDNTGENVLHDKSPLVEQWGSLGIKRGTACTWEQTSSNQRPYILFSPTTTYVNWNDEECAECDQVCTYTNREFQCSCYAGYTSNENSNCVGTWSLQPCSLIEKEFICEKDPSSYHDDDCETTANNRNYTELKHVEEAAGDELNVYIPDMTECDNCMAKKTSCGNIRCGIPDQYRCGLIYSPGYPDAFPSSVYCLWTIDGPPGSYVTLVLLDVDLPCASRALQVRDRFLTVGWNTIHGLCHGEGEQKRYVSSSNEMRLVMLATSNNANFGDNRGFMATFNVSTFSPSRQVMSIPDDAGFICPCGWRLFRRNCYLTSRHHVRVNWEESDVKCREFGANLTSVADRAEMEFLHLLLVTNVVVKRIADPQLFIVFLTSPVSLLLSKNEQLEMEMEKRDQPDEDEVLEAEAEDLQEMMMEKRGYLDYKACSNHTFSGEAAESHSGSMGTQTVAPKDHLKSQLAKLKHAVDEMLESSVHEMTEYQCKQTADVVVSLRCILTSTTIKKPQSKDERVASSRLLKRFNVAT